MIKVEQTFNALPGHKAVGHETFGHIGHFRGHAQNGGGVSGLEQGMADRIVHGHDLVRVLKGYTAFSSLRRRSSSIRLRKVMSKSTQVR